MSATSLTIIVCGVPNGGYRVQAPPAMLAERHGRRGSQATWPPALPLPAAMPVGYGPCAESPASDLLWRLAAGTALWGFNSVSWGFNSAARSSGPVCEAAAAVRELPGSSRRLSPCFPDDQAQRCGCRSPARACGPIPTDRPHRFRSSHAWTGRAGRYCRLFSPAKCGPGRPLSC